MPTTHNNSADQSDISIQRAFDPNIEGATRFFDEYYPDGNISRVLLVNPPDASIELFDFNIARRGTLSNFPPYGLAVLAEHLRKQDIDVRVTNLNHEVLKACFAAKSEDSFDFTGTWKACLDKDIATFKPQLIGITCMFTMTHNSFKDVCAHAAISEIPVAVGGVHVTNDVEYILDDLPFVKVAFLRESDEALKVFIRAIRREVTPEELRQVIIVDKNVRLRFLEEKT